MQRRRFMLASSAQLGLGVLFMAACGGSAPAKAAQPKATGKTATIELEKGGTITIQLMPDGAPNTVQNFEDKSNKGYYNGLTFHRVEDWVVQGGDPRGNGTGGGTMPTELNQRPFTAGSVGVARGQDIRISNDSQFFIVKLNGPAELGGKWTQLDGQYTNFGQVTSGMEVVTAIKIGDKIKKITVKG